MRFSRIPVKICEEVSDWSEMSLYVIQACVVKNSPALNEITNSRNKKKDTYASTRLNHYLAFLFLCSSTIEAAKPLRRHVCTQQQFMEAVCDGSVSAVQAMIQSGEDVELCDEDGKTLLILAVLRGQRRIAQDLIQAGANINARDQRGTSALIAASMRGYRG